MTCALALVMLAVEAECCLHRCSHVCSCKRQRFRGPGQVRSGQVMGLMVQVLDEAIDEAMDVS